MCDATPHERMLVQVVPMSGCWCTPHERMLVQVVPGHANIDRPGHVLLADH